MSNVSNDGTRGSSINTTEKTSIRIRNYSWLSSNSSGSNWQVSSSNSESVDGVSDVVDSLKKAVGIDVLVGASGYSISITGLSTGRWASGMSKRELSELILSVELGRRSRVDSPGVASNKYLGT